MGAVASSARSPNAATPDDVRPIRDRQRHLLAQNHSGPPVNLKLDELYALAKDSYGAMLRFVTTRNTPFLATVSKNGIAVVTQSGRRGGPKPSR
jgi:hypothetical protein